MNNIKKLYINYDILDYYSTMTTTLNSFVMVEKPNKWMIEAVIDLKLRLGNRNKAITMVIYSKFIKLFY